MKTLVVYYSLEGNTKEAAIKISTALNADILELKPVKDVPKEGSNKFIIGGMKATFGMTTKLEPIHEDLDKYTQIILGTPVWASKSAPAVNEFLKIFKNHEKIVGLFTCSGGGDNDKCVKTMKKKLHNLQHTVALADKNNENMARLNNDKLTKFINYYK